MIRDDEPMENKERSLIVKTLSYLVYILLIQHIHIIEENVQQRRGTKMLDHLHWISVCQSPLY